MQSYKEYLLLKDARPNFISRNFILARGITLSDTASVSLRHLKICKGLHLRQDAPFKDLEKKSVQQVELQSLYVLGEKRGKWNRKYPNKTSVFCSCVQQIFQCDNPRISIYQRKI